MLYTLLSEIVISSSITKVILTLLLVLIWGKWATIVDKDAMRMKMDRERWNTIQVCGLLAGAAAIFFVPLFVAGFPIGVVIVGATAYAYFRAHNDAATNKEQIWTLNADFVKKLFSGIKVGGTKLPPTTIKFPKAPAGMSDVPDGREDEERYMAHVQLQEFIEEAFRREAQRIDLNVTDAEMAVMMTVDGVEYPLSKTPSAAGIAMIDYLKEQCKLDASDRRRKQAGGCRVISDTQGKQELSIRTSGSTKGLQCSIWINRDSQVDIKFSELGLLEAQQAQLSALTEKVENGVILVAGPEHHGRTTTLYSLLGHFDPYTVDMHTLEPEIELDLEGITQHELEPTDVRKHLQSLLLREPEVVMISSVSDQELAKVVADAGSKGPLLIAGMRGTDTFNTLKVWVKALGDAELASRGLKAIVAQRLVRRLCTICRQQYKPDAASLKKLNLSADKVEFLYKNSGQVMIKNKPEQCPACHGTGYRGQIGAYEVMLLDDEARAIIREGNLDKLRTHMRRNKMTWLQESALSMIASGVTSISEVTRALGQGGK
jgi:type II secretory ATPase GspE/PulE/Tfp pilus assembly ATPase PilB-like protein